MKPFRVFFCARIDGTPQDFHRDIEARSVTEAAKEGRAIARAYGWRFLCASASGADGPLAIAGLPVRLATETREGIAA